MMKSYFYIVLLTLALVTNAFQISNRQQQQRPFVDKSISNQLTQHGYPMVQSRRQKRSSIVEMKMMIHCAGIFGGMKDFMKRFTTKASASHILIKGGAEAENKLEDLKFEIGNSPVKFAEYAAQYSECPSASSGGSLGEFGPGAMVKEFDQVVFNEAVGQVHGPIKTQFGYHLIYIRDRTE
jgi:peptidyl-prolyl cis-trans isomerase C